MTTDELETTWDRYRAGMTPAKIARDIGRDRDAVRRQINTSGGIRPTIPKRATRHLTLEEREISRGLAAGERLREIARDLGRAASTISREVTVTTESGPAAASSSRNASNDARSLASPDNGLLTSHDSPVVRWGFSLPPRWSGREGNASTNPTSSDQDRVAAEPGASIPGRTGLAAFDWPADTVVLTVDNSGHRSEGSTVADMRSVVPGLRLDG